LPAWLYDFLGLGEIRPVGVVPFVLVDFGFEPSVGLYAYWDDAGFQGHELRLRGSTWGRDWLHASATERFQLSPAFELTLKGSATRRPDYAFYGIGPDTREASLVRYSGDTAQARFESKLTFYGRSELETTAGYRGAAYGHDHYDGTSLDDAVARGRLAEPPGFRDGYRAPYGAVRLLLDSRGGSNAKNGLRLELNGEQSVDLKNMPASGWLRYGATLLGFFDLRQGGRTLSLALSTQLVDPLGDRPVPFAQLATLGGTRTMPGFRTGRLYDRSFVAASLIYSWPIWLGLNGSIQLGAGNVFGAHFSGLRPGRARLSTALGLETRVTHDHIFELLGGFGTETFESGMALDSLRFVAGVRSAF
jgi:hypothetical protein